MQRRTGDDQAHSAIQDAVAHQMNLTLVGRRPTQAKRFASEDTGRTRCDNSEREGFQLC